MTTWQDLEAELDSWAGVGLEATFWWRDDDAVEPTAALDRLLVLAADCEIPVAIAVIPARCSGALAERLAGAGGVATTLQHGHAHLNHAPAGEKKAELGSHRPSATICEELGRGNALMAGLFGPETLPVLVPPWNRISAELLPILPTLGLTGLSTHGPRSNRSPAENLTQTNTHADIMRWTSPRGFLGEPEALGLLLGHLRARRHAAEKEAGIDPLEPTGLLTHHPAHDEAAWTFLARLLPWLAGHAATRALSAAEAFGDPPRPNTGGDP